MLSGGEHRAGSAACDGKNETNERGDEMHSGNRVPVSMLDIDRVGSKRGEHRQGTYLEKSAFRLSPGAFALPPSRRRRT